MSPRSAATGGLAAAGSGQATSAEARRLALRRFASGVTVLTVNHEGLRHGTTVSAVVPISRDPLVLGVCLRASSGLSALLRQGGTFSVNILSSEQAAVARQFAAPGRVRGDAQFAGVDWSTDRLTGAPLIDGCLAHLACSFTGCQRIGDHDLITAEVLAGFPAAGDPLLTFAGQLCQEGPRALGVTTA